MESDIWAFEVVDEITPINTSKKEKMT